MNPDSNNNSLYQATPRSTQEMNTIIKTKSGGKRKGRVDNTGNVEKINRCRCNDRSKNTNHKKGKERCKKLIT